MKTQREADRIEPQLGRLSVEYDIQKANGDPPPKTGFCSDRFLNHRSTTLEVVFLLTLTEIRGLSGFFLRHDWPPGLSCRPDAMTL
ncbi:MAG: hypothetical protein ACREUI_00295 [Burkholderiales bacterium]